jgi:hypothetical protein
MAYLALWHKPPWQEANKLQREVDTAVAAKDAAAEAKVAATLRLSALQREVDAKAIEMARLQEQLSFSSEMADKMAKLRRWQ